MTMHESEIGTAGIGFWSDMRGRGSELFKQARIIGRHNPAGVLGVFLVVSIILVALFAPQIAIYDPNTRNIPERSQPPSAEHLFGTDVTGRDLFSRVVYGSRISIQVAVTVLSIAVMIGIVVGTLAGYYGGLIDEILMRITDIFLAFPSLVLAMAVNAALGPGLESAILAIAFTWWPGYARTIRGQVLSTKNNLHVLASRSIGATNWRLLVRHILPSCISPLIVLVTLDAGFVVLTTAGLSFVGLGVQPPTPEWGSMVGEGQKYILSLWWWSTFPGLAICMLVVGTNLAGDFLRDLLEPRMRDVGA
jgi:peptide/nickel transport system permease protein